MFRAHVLIVRRAKLYYTVYGIITPIGGRPVHPCTKFYNKFISSLYIFQAHVLIVRRAKLYYTVSGINTPIGLHISSTCAHRQEGKIVLYSLWYQHTYRSTCFEHTCSSSGGQNSIIQSLESTHL